MKRTISILLASWMTAHLAFAQSPSPFDGRFVNKEFNIFLHLNLTLKNIIVPNHDLLGELPGYLGKNNNNFYWLITDGEQKNHRQATLSLINDYGSEDLTASFEMKNDSVFILKQDAAGTLKIPNKGKWQKLPKTIEFIKK